MTENVPQWLAEGCRAASILLAFRAAACVVVYDMDQEENEAGVALLAGLLGWMISAAMFFGLPATHRNVAVHAGAWVLCLGIAKFVRIKASGKPRRTGLVARLLCEPGACLKGVFNGRTGH